MVSYNEEKNNSIIEKNFIKYSKLKNKNIILRVDWNIPFELDMFNNNNFKINDDFRITSSLETINIY